MTNVSTRRDAICERCTSKRNSRCCIYPFLILGCQPKTTWNRQSNTQLPTHKQDSTSSFTAQRALGGLDCLQRTWQSAGWVFLGLRLFSGFDVLFPELWKPLGNNGW